jgi:hypothetical protein
MQIIDTSDPSSRSSAETEEFAHFKRDIYQKVLKIIFESLRRRSHDGDTHRCADGISRILHPGILIESQDAEEAAYFCGCRAARATHPCPKCLVSHSELHEIFGNFELRTPDNMRAALQKVASAKTKADRQRILVKYGLHDIPVRLLHLKSRSALIHNVQHFLWDFRFSDPYKAISYDTLHSDDLGKWGKHLWVLLLDPVLEDARARGKVTQR